MNNLEILKKVLRNCKYNACWLMGNEISWQDSNGESKNLFLKNCNILEFIKEIENDNSLEIQVADMQFVIRLKKV